jgi:fumarate hydratase, class II
MISSLSARTAKINPLLLQNLQRLYIIRARVFNNLNLQEQNVEQVFNQLNVYSDGKGVSVLKKFDELFDFQQHKQYPEKQYELLNTSYVDAIYITAVKETEKLLKEIKELIATFEAKEKAIEEKLNKIARSNGPLVDMKVKDMYANWKNYLTPFIEYLESDIKKLQKIPLGSNLETKLEKLKEMYESNKEQNLLEEVNKEFGNKFESADSRLVAISQLSPIVQLSGTLNNLATVAMKIANDVRFLSSGPRSGYGELTIPENEPGSSIMPGKVNPTQCESLSMVASQVIGNHTAISIANSSAMFESNHFKPLIGNNTIRSLRLLEDGFRSFRVNCAVGIELVESRIKENLNFMI